MKQQKFGTELGLDVKDPLCELCEDVPSDLSVMIVVVKSPKFSPAGRVKVSKRIRISGGRGWMLRRHAF